MYDKSTHLNIDFHLTESLRKYPPAPAYCRKCTRDYNIPGTNVIIPKDTTLLIPTLAVHRDPEYYPNPDVFDPERFSEENRATSKENAYIPFGAGPRMCIGKFSIIFVNGLIYFFYYYYFRNAFRYDTI